MRIIIAIFVMLLVAFAPFTFRQHATQAPTKNDADTTNYLRRVRIVAAGDLMVHTPQITSARTSDGNYDFSKSFEYIKLYFKSADIAILNLETTLSHNHQYTGYPCFKSPIAVAYAMRDIGIDIAALANNHCCDGGAMGVRSTIEVLDSLGIKRLGVYRDSIDYKNNNILYLKQNGISLAFVNYTYGTNGLPTPRGMIINRIDTVAMARDFAAIARDSVDCLTVIIHWGNEYERHPNLHQKKLAEFMHRHGVDIILGSHPHVVQPLEIDVNKGVTLWSMGNFISNQRKRFTDGGIIGVIELEKIGDGPIQYSLDIIPIWVKRPDYKIIPEPIGDTLPMSEYDRFCYERFMTDTKQILSM